MLSFYFLALGGFYTRPSVALSGPDCGATNERQPKVVA